MSADPRELIRELAEALKGYAYAIHDKRHVGDWDYRLCVDPDVHSRAISALCRAESVLAEPDHTPVRTPCDDCKAERDRLAAELTATRAEATRTINEAQARVYALTEERDAALVQAQRERDAYATLAAERLAEKHLADEDHASDVEIVRERERQWAAAQVREYNQWPRGSSAWATVEKLADRIERGPAEEGE